MHQHRFRDALQTSWGCWALREPTRKERAGEQAGRGRARARGCALRPRTLCGACPGLGAPGAAEAAEEAPAPFPPPPFPLRYWKACVGETQKHPDFRARGGGGPGSRCCSKENQKCVLFAPLRHAAAPGRGPVAPTVPRFAAPQDLAKAVGGPVWRGKRQRGE